MGMMDWLGLNNANNMMGSMNPSSWDYNAATSSSPLTNSWLTGAVNNMNETAGNLTGKGNALYDQGQQFMDPNSAHYAKQRAFLQEDVRGGITEGTRQMNQNLAARGLGSGGIRGVLGATNASQIGEQVRQGSNDMYLQGMNTGTNLLGLGMQGIQGAGSLYSGVAQQGSDLANRGMQQSQFNVGQRNQANQFNAQNQKDAWTMKYNNAAAQDANQAGIVGGVISAGVTAKMFFMCIPEGTEIDTAIGSTPIGSLRAGDEIIGYNGATTTILQKHEYKENPKAKRFLEITLSDGEKVNLCDMHRIEGIHSKEYSIGDKVGGRLIADIKWYDGVNRSYDLLTSDEGYRISGVPVNSMIEELTSKAKELQEVL